MKFTSAFLATIAATASASADVTRKLTGANALKGIPVCDTVNADGIPVHSNGIPCVHPETTGADVDWAQFHSTADASANTADAVAEAPTDADAIPGSSDVDETPEADADAAAPVADTSADVDADADAVAPVADADTSADGDADAAAPVADGDASADGDADAAAPVADGDAGADSGAAGGICKSSIEANTDICGQSTTEVECGASNGACIWTPSTSYTSPDEMKKMLDADPATSTPQELPPQTEDASAGEMAKDDKEAGDDAAADKQDSKSEDGKKKDGESEDNARRARRALRGRN